MKLLATTISFLILGSLSAQREQPETHLGSKFSKSTKCLNPEYLLFPSKPKGDEKPALLIYLPWSRRGGDDVRRLQGQARALLEGIKKFKKGLDIGFRNDPKTWEASDGSLAERAEFKFEL